MVYINDKDKQEDHSRDPWGLIMAGGPSGPWPGIINQKTGWIVVDRVMSDSNGSTKNTKQIINEHNSFGILLDKIAELQKLLSVDNLTAEIRRLTEFIESGKRCTCPSDRPMRSSHARTCQFYEIFLEKAEASTNQPHRLTPAEADLMFRGTPEELNGRCD